jgi:hypothetical protein
MLAKAKGILSFCRSVMAAKADERGGFETCLLPMQPVEHEIEPFQFFKRCFSKGITPLFMMRFFFIAYSLFELPLCVAKPVSDLSKAETVSPFPAVVAVAQVNHIPMQAIDPPAASGTNVTPGDSVTALVTLSEKGASRTQWLLYLQAVEPGPKEKAGKPPAPVVFFSSCGNKFEFASSPAFVSLRSIGPFTEPGLDTKSPALQDMAARFAVNQGILGIGLDRAAAALHRTVQIGTQGGFQFREKPFSPAETKESRILAQKVHLTSDEERSLSGVVPAMLSYSDFVQQTKDLNDVVLRIVNMPSIWSVIWNGGVQPNWEVQSDRVELADAATWGLPPHTPVYYFPMLLKLNKDDVFNVTLVVTAPRPPLLACGGVIGLTAEKVGDKDTCLTLRIVSAHRIQGQNPSTGRPVIATGDGTGGMQRVYAARGITPR